MFAVEISVLIFISLCVRGGLSAEGQGVPSSLRTVMVTPNKNLVTQPLANLSIFSVNEIGNSMGVGCCTPSEAPLGNWLDPDGTVIGRQRPDVTLYTLERISRVDLFRDNPITSAERGVYTCRVRDTEGADVDLYVGIYPEAGPPQLSPNISLSINASTSPLTFTLTCTSSSFLPSSVTWSRSDSMLPEQQSSLVLRDARTSTFDSILSVVNTFAGVYRCTARNSEGGVFAEREIQVPTEVPSNVAATPAGENTVRVSWTPTSKTMHYVVTYVAGEGGERQSVTVLGMAADSAILEGLSVDVEYFISVQAFGDLPGLESTSSVSITLRAPPPPESVAANRVSSTSIDVSWDDPNNPDVTGFLIEFTPAKGDCEGISGGNTSLEREATSHTLDGLEEFTKYDVIVRSRGDQGVGQPSSSVQAMTERSLPSAPSIVKVEGHVNPRGFTLTYEDLPCQDVNAANVTEYIIMYSRAGADPSPVRHAVARSSPHTIIDRSFISLVGYQFQLAAVNTLAQGPYSSPVVAAILEGPGEVNDLSTSPDITSILVTWEPPDEDEGRDFVTGYEVQHQLFLLRANPIRTTPINSSVTSLIVSDLLPKETYQFTVTAMVGAGVLGASLVVTQSTQKIGVVQGVQVFSVGSSEVQITWRRLISRDVSSYRVYYKLLPEPSDKARRQAGGSGEVRVTFSANQETGVVGGLEEGAEYSFEMVAVVNVGGVEREGGVRSNPSNVIVQALTSPDEGLETPAIIGIVLAIIIFAVIVIVVILAAFAIWRRSTTGRYIVKKASADYELNQPHSPSHHQQMPLPDFEPFIPTSKPVIQENPVDITAMEGQRVTFRPKVAGSPIPTVAWYHEGSMVVSDYAVDVNEDGTLTFVCVELKHAGTYRFTVSNSAGSVQGKVQLKVYSDDQDNNETDSYSLLTKKVAVREFGEYVEQLHSNNNNNFREQFFWLPGREEDHQTTCAHNYENKSRNRFINAIVYDDNRIRLHPIGNIHTCQHDYINACYIKGYFMAKKFVATQGPTESTVIDFWRLVWQLRTPTIVMITNLVEGGKTKCARYWPESDALDYGPFRVFLSAETDYGNYIVRTLHVNLTVKTQSPLKVIQYHFTAWPDHGVPDYVAPMLAFHRRIKMEHKSTLGPMLVHCSAGVGRTGTFIALDIALQQASGEDAVDLPAIITHLREQRMKMVQTQEQYTFLHDAVLESLVCGNTQLPLHDLKRCVESLRRWDPTTGKSGFQSQFQVLEQMSPKASEVVSSSAKGSKKNRYDNYLPSDKHRVVLKAEYPDYIHATFVDGYKQKRKFIVTQGPLENTCRDFWKMVYERNCGSIVMLSGVMENGEEVCYKYWPTQGIEQYGEYDVSPLEQSMHDSFLERIFSVTDSKSGQAHRVSQFQLLNWEPEGVTFNMNAVLTVINCVTSLQKTNHTGPIVVHCSDTVTRSGIFCAVANAIECMRIEKVIDIFQVVKMMRSQRPGAVPTVEQYEIIHDIVLYHTQSLSDHIL